MEEEKVQEEVVVEEQDPLCPMVPISLEERREWCKPWKQLLTINLLGKMIDFNFLKTYPEKL